MRSPRIEGPPVLQPVTESAAAVSVANRDSIETPVDDSASDDGNPATPPMPVLVEGEDFGDADASSFELVEEMSPAKLDAKSDAASDVPPPPLINGVAVKDNGDIDAPPVITNYAHDERVNGDHEEPVLEKFFRLFTPSAPSPQRKEAVNDLLAAKPLAAEPSVSNKEAPPLAKSTPAEAAVPSPVPPASASESGPSATPSPATKRRRQYTPRRKATGDADRSPSAKRARGKHPRSGPSASSGEKASGGRARPPGKSSSSKKEAAEVFDFASENERVDCPSRPSGAPRKRGPKPKTSEERAGAKQQQPAGRQKTTANENRYLRSPYIISTAENDSIMSRFQVVNPAFRDAASVNVTDHPFKHSVKLPPHAGLAKSAWVCVFCGLGTAFANLGCLFGPYYIDFNKFTAHADLISIGNPDPAPTPTPAVEKAPPKKATKQRDPSPQSLPSSQVTSTVTSSTPVSPTVTAAVPPASDGKSGEEKAGEAAAGAESSEQTAGEGRRRTMRRLSRSSNTTSHHSSISSFRSSKARASQMFAAAKDVRRCSVDSDKAPSNVKQVDIASVFFSSGDQSADKKEDVKINGKDTPLRRKSDAKEEKEEKKAKEAATPKGSSENATEAKNEPVSATATPQKGRRSKAMGKRKSPKATPQKGATPKRGAGRPPKEPKEPPRPPNNCQTAKSQKNPRERQLSSEPRPAEQRSDTRIAANGEAWVHLECVMWASGTYLNGKQIVGLEDALSEALQSVCKVCKLRGAMVACVQRGCDRTFHYYCAIQDDCYLDYEQFCIYCSKHKKKNAMQVTSYWSEPSVHTF